MTACTRSHPALAAGRPLRILVVDDEPILREVAGFKLGVPGGVVLTAADGEEAWRLLNEHGPVDLVLTDLDMPGLNGFGLLERVRQSPLHASLPVVVLTGSPDFAAVDAAYAAGAAAFITKPVNWQLLGYQIGSVLRAATLETELRAARDSARDAAEAERNLLMLLQHETRTPLNAIIGRCEILNGLLGRSEVEPAQAEAGQVMEAAWQLNETLRRVFYLAQLIAGTLPLDPEVMPLSTVVEESVRIVRDRAARAGIRISMPELGSAPAVACDLRALSGAVVELLINAITHAGDAASVAVTWSHDADGSAILEVRDSGAGLTPEQLAIGTRLFAQKGDALTRETGGLGIGLATAQGVAELHGGRLELGSQMGQGTWARLILPDAGGLPGSQPLKKMSVVTRSSGTRIAPDQAM